jgi:hypothetical protein
MVSGLATIPNVPFRLCRNRPKNPRIFDSISAPCNLSLTKLITGGTMKTSFFSAIVLALLATGASAQQYYTTSYYAVNQATPHEQPHLHDYSGQHGLTASGYFIQPQAGYYLPNATYVQPQSGIAQSGIARTQNVYVGRQHHKPESLVGYWPFISKAHSDRDFDRNWIHVYKDH